ncbi:winged helix-turn-helix domain-containing protein [Enterobacteriaceae bacterium BIT-l23]|uniref:winged helix-turn-helix domain-containing protein n=1 Tax=Jejubacter sp. L23 TaxID=3092086 RepID=UPI0015850226|nr:winged helix-turn-helix domain-containing protein [Enterobacteriaceae bacterium BIT-l23]
MRYTINARLIYDATDGTLTLANSDDPGSQLSITASALLCFFLNNTSIVSRDEVLQKVWDDNGLTSSNSNLNQYLSMLRKTFRHYGIDNIIISVSRGHLQLNPDVHIQMPAPAPAPALEIQPQPTPAPEHAITEAIDTPQTHGLCWYLAGTGMLIIALLLVLLSMVSGSTLLPVALTPIHHSQCELLASDVMLHSVSETTYVKNFDAVLQRLNLKCKPGERFIFDYLDRLETNGLGRVFMAHCAMNENNPFSYCNNYFYYSWKP